MTSPTVVTYRNFETGAVDDLAEDSNGMSQTIRMYWDDVANGGQVHSGTQSGRNEVFYDTNVYGGEIAFPALTKGQEVWARLWCWYPADPTWKFAVGTGDSGIGTKTLRVHVESTTGGGSIGYISCLIDYDSSNYLIYSNEADNFWFNHETGEIGSPGQGPNTADTNEITREAWNYLEIYMYLTDVRDDRTGGRDGINIRFWENGNLARESRSSTLDLSTDRVNDILIGNYWNGGAPQDQECWHDDVLVISANPPNTDAAGNPMIGTWSPSDGSLFAEDIESISELSVPVLNQIGINALLADNAESLTEVSSPVLSQIGINALLADNVESISELSIPVLLTKLPVFGAYDKTNIIQPEVFGFSVLRESFGFTVGSEVMGFTVNPETMGMNANKLIQGTDEADSYYLYGSGESVLYGSGEEVEA